MLKILYISDLDKAAPIFHSQVLPHMAELKKHFDIYAIILKRSPVDTADNPDFYYYNSIRGDYYYYMAKFCFFRQKRKLETLLHAHYFDIVYSRGIRGGLVGSFIKKYFYRDRILHVNDVRGFALDDLGDHFWTRPLVSKLNKTLYGSADMVFAVSQFLKTKICREFSFDPGKAFVFPTFVPDGKFDFNEANRSQIRKELGYTENDLVLLYSGNLAKWQNVDIILSAFRQSSNPNLKLLFLTKEKEITTIMDKMGLRKERVIVKSVRYEEIEKYYHAADFGILIRDNTITNKCAAPTKFSEYVNGGLSLIINTIDADYIRFFQDEKLSGFLLDRKEDLESCFNNIGLADRKRNKIKVNTLSEIVKGQAELLKACCSGVILEATSRKSSQQTEKV